MAYAKGLPILVIVETGVRAEGLIEKGYDWYVMTVQPNQNSLQTDEFNGVLSSWKNKIERYKISKQNTIQLKRKVQPGELTIGELISNMKPAQLWSVLAAIIALMVSIFVIGQHFPSN